LVYESFQIILSNLGLHKYRLSESDKGADSDSNDSDERDVSSNDNNEAEISKQLEEVQPALGSYWREIVDYRFMITTPPYIRTSILGFVKAPRFVTLVDPHISKTVSIEISDFGVVDEASDTAFHDI
jgi:hypothetical protein